MILNPEPVPFLLVPSDGLQMVLEWPRVRLACCPPPEGIIPILVYVLGLPGTVQCVHMATRRGAHALLSTTTKSLNTIAACESIQQQISSFMNFLSHVFIKKSLVDADNIKVEKEAVFRGFQSL